MMMMMMMWIGHRRIAGGAWGCCSTPKSRKFLGCRSEIFITYLYKKRTLYYCKNVFVGNLVTAAPPQYSSVIRLRLWDRMNRCRDMAVRNFPKCDYARSAGRSSVLIIYIVVMYSSSLRLERSARAVKDNS